jgi:hypothetical protein
MSDAPPGYPVGYKKPPLHSAYSGERDQPFRLKVITDSGDRDHAVHGRHSPA